MARDVNLSGRIWDRASFARLRTNDQLCGIQLAAITDDDGRLLDSDIDLAWRFHCRLEHWQARRDRLIAAGVLVADPEGWHVAEWMYSSGAGHARDVYLSGDLWDDPRFAMLRARDRLRVIRLMAYGDEEGCVRYTDAQLAWRFHCRPEFWLACRLRLVESGAAEADAAGFLVMALFLYGEVWVRDERAGDTGAAWQPDPAFNGFDRPRKPSDAREQTRARKQRSRARQSAGNGSESAPDSPQGRDMAMEVTPEAARDRPRDPREHAVSLDPESFESKDPESGAGAPTNGSGSGYISGRPQGREGWRETNERLARHSAGLVGDPQSSLGLHIRIWSEARKWDQRRKNTLIVDSLMGLLTTLQEDRRRTGRHQGDAWNARAQILFKNHGLELPFLPSDATPEQIAEAQAALSHLSHPPATPEGGAGP